MSLYRRALRHAVMELRRIPRPLLPIDIYIVPKVCDSDESFARYHGHDLTGRDRLDLLAELRLVEIRLGITPKQEIIERDWLVAHHRRLSRELARRGRP
jgi:hypothetical protein